MGIMENRRNRKIGGCQTCQTCRTSLTGPTSPKGPKGPTSPTSPKGPTRPTRPTPPLNHALFKTTSTPITTDVASSDNDSASHTPETPINLGSRIKHGTRNTALRNSENTVAGFTRSTF